MTIALFSANVLLKNSSERRFIAIFRRADGSYNVLSGIHHFNAESLGTLKRFLKTLSGGSANNMQMSDEITQKEINAIWNSLFH